MAVATVQPQPPVICSGRPWASDPGAPASAAGMPPSGPQPATGLCWQVLDTHVSMVHGLVSAQSPSVWQHPGVLVVLQVPVVVSQVLVVHGLLSVQSALL